MALDKLLGTKQKLKISKRAEFGVYLSDEEGYEVLLPKKQVPEEAEIGDILEVFLYRDSSDRLISTTNEPKLLLGEVAILEVKEVGSIGAFLDWGLEKDLLLPYSEQVKKAETGDKVLVALYLDKSSRLCATMKVYSYLKGKSLYRRNDVVTGILFGKSEQYGYFLAVDNKYLARIAKKDVVGSLAFGGSVVARVTENHADGKLDLSMKKPVPLQMGDDAKTVLEAIKEDGGVLALNDKSAPEDIEKRLGLSKNAFKRAVGRLLKEDKIRINTKNIELLKK
jgi:predicted RNA-binding protein (virulence factor B family)